MTQIHINEAINYLENYQTKFEERRTPGNKQMPCSQQIQRTNEGIQLFDQTFKLGALFGEKELILPIPY